MGTYFLLAFLTLTIFVLAVAIWRKTRELAFPLGIGFLYYWSLYGAWSIVTDKLGGDSGMHYDYLEQKMFSIKLDSNYVKSIILYGLFIIIVEVVVLKLTQRGEIRNRHSLLRQVSHIVILSIAAAAGLFSYWIVKDSIELAAALNVSAYAALRSADADVPLLFTVHQIFNTVALVPTAVGFAVLCSGKRPRFLSGPFSNWTVVSYVAVLGAMAAFCLVLGMKNQLFVAGLAGLLFYVANAERAKKFLLVGAIFVGFTGLSVMESLRGVPLPDLANAARGVDAVDLLRSLRFLASSDEAFGAHLSMYGVLSQNVPLTFGSSFVSLGTSLIPRIFWPGRPPDIYAYYAERVGAQPGQGYSIHHATGWYLNFGTLGVIIGGIVFGYIWAKCFNRRASAKPDDGDWAYCFKVTGPTMVAAFIPSLIRAGPEAYKGLLLDAFLIPTAVLGFAVWRHARVSARRSSVPVVHKTGELRESFE
jgi:hypothetical protein